MKVVEIDNSGSLVVFKDYPDQAALIFYSTVPDLNFKSTMGVVSTKESDEQGKYVLIIRPVKQRISISSRGYLENSLTISGLSSRDVNYYSVQPEDPKPVSGRGNLLLVSDPSGVKISIDGFPDFSERTPYTFNNYAAQSYIFQFSMDEYKTEQKVITIKKGETIRRDIVLTPSYSFLNFNIPGNTTVSIDQRRRKVSNNEPIKVEAGTIQLTLARDDYEIIDTLIITPRGETVTIDPKWTPTFGYLDFEINSENTPLSIYLDGRLKDWNNINRYQVPVGKHRLEIRSQGFQPYIDSLVIRPGSTLKIDETLNSNFGKVTANIQPADAEVWLNNNKLPLINGFYRIPAGKQILQLRRESYQREEISLDVEAGENYTLNQHLDPSYGWLKLDVKNSNGKTIQYNIDVPESYKVSNLPENVNSEDPVPLYSGNISFTVNSNSYNSTEISATITPGKTTEKSVIMYTVGQAADLERRKKLQPAVLNVKSDPLSDIYINGQRAGKSEVVENIVPGDTEITIEHPSGTASKKITLSEGELRELYLSTLPKKSVALISGILPGVGHIYTQRKRGWLYLTGTVGSALFTGWQYIEYQDKKDSFYEMQDTYNNATTLDEATDAREKLLEIETEMNNTYTILGYSAISTLSLYALSYIDLLIFKPKWGYQKNVEFRSSIGMIHVPTKRQGSLGFALDIRF
jgi:hypothetical protein